MRTNRLLLGSVMLGIGSMFLAVAAAQQTQHGGNEKHPPVARVSLFALGDLPYNGIRIVGGKVVAIVPKASESPPVPIYLNLKRQSGNTPSGVDGTSAARAAADEMVFLAMNAPTQPFYRQGSKLILYTQDRAVYASIDLPPPPANHKIIQDLTVFLLRNADSRDWQKTPQSRIVKNDIVSFPLGCCRMVNLSSATILITIDKTKTYEIKPNDIRVLSIPAKAGTSDIAFGYKVVARCKTGGTYGYNQRFAAGDIPISVSGTRYPATERVNFVFYNHDGYTEPEDTSKMFPIGFTRRCELPAANKPPVRPAESPAPAASP